MEEKLVRWSVRIGGLAMAAAVASTLGSAVLGFRQYPSFASHGPAVWVGAVVIWLLVWVICGRIYNLLSFSYDHAEIIADTAVRYIMGLVALAVAGFVVGMLMRATNWSWLMGVTVLSATSLILYGLTLMLYPNLAKKKIIWRSAIAYLLIAVILSGEAYPILQWEGGQSVSWWAEAIGVLLVLILNAGTLWFWYNQFIGTLRSRDPKRQAAYAVDIAITPFSLPVSIFNQDTIWW